jgi:hypothetical protein
MVVPALNVNDIASIMRGFAKGNHMEKRKRGKTEILFCSVLHSCFVPFSFSSGTDVIFLGCSCHVCNSGSKLASMYIKTLQEAWLILVKRNKTLS